VRSVTMLRMSPDMPEIRRGAVWRVDFDPTRGHEQAGIRPALVLSVDGFNNGPARLAVVAPLTTRDRRIVSHVPITPPNGGVRIASFIKCEDIRSVSTERFLEPWGSVSGDVLAQVEDWLRILLGL
jgi:mRNA interferase MazF